MREVGDKRGNGKQIMLEYSYIIAGLLVWTEPVDCQFNNVRCIAAGELVSSAKSQGIEKRTLQKLFAL